MKNMNTMMLELSQTKIARIVQFQHERVNDSQRAQHLDAAQRVLTARGLRGALLVSVVEKADGDGLGARIEIHQLGTMSLLEAMATFGLAKTCVDRDRAREKPKAPPEGKRCPDCGEIHGPNTGEGFFKTLLEALGEKP